MFSNNDVIYSGDEFYVSYSEQRNELAQFCDNLAFMIGGKEPRHDLPETALCIRTGLEGLKSVRFLILYGDHREQYSKLIPDLQACIKYFNDHIDQIGHSSELPVEKVS